jgi:hypothetical protein
MFRLWLKFLLPSAVFRRPVKLQDFGKGNDKFVFCLGSYTAASRIGAQFLYQIVETKKNPPCGDEPDEGLTTFEALYQATDPLGHPGAYASSKYGFFFIFEGL